MHHSSTYSVRQAATHAASSLGAALAPYGGDRQTSCRVDCGSVASNACADPTSVPQEARQLPTTTWRFQCAYICTYICTSIIIILIGIIITINGVF